LQATETIGIVLLINTFLIAFFILFFFVLLVSKKKVLIEILSTVFIGFYGILILVTFFSNEYSVNIKLLLNFIFEALFLTGLFTRLIICKFQSR